MSWYDLVYFARFCCRIKIGVSNNALRRVFDDLHCDELLGVEIGGRDREAALHRQFAHCRIRGEWFESNPDLLAYIASLPHDPLDQQIRFLGDESARLRREHAELAERATSAKFGMDEIKRRQKELDKALAAAESEIGTEIARAVTAQRVAARNGDT